MRASIATVGGRTKAHDDCGGFLPLRFSRPGVDKVRRQAKRGWLEKTLGDIGKHWGKRGRCEGEKSVSKLGGRGILLGQPR